MLALLHLSDSTEAKLMCTVSGAWGSAEPESPGAAVQEFQEEAELANAKLSQATMELDDLQAQLEKQRQESNEKVARLQKEVDLAKHARDGEVAGIVGVSYYPGPCMCCDTLLCSLSRMPRTLQRGNSRRQRPR